MKIGVIGTGYVGLTQLLCMSSYLPKHKFIGYDIDENKIRNLNEGISPIYEEGINEILSKDLEQGNLSFTTNIDDLNKCEVVFIAVGTPTIETKLSNGSIDYSQDLAYINGVIDKLKLINLKVEYQTLVIKSTVLPGTCERIVNSMSNEDKSRFVLCNNPEFLREGFALKDFLVPDKVVLGISIDKSDPRYTKVSNLLTSLYLPIIDKSKIIVSSVRVSQAIKYVNNDMLGTKLAKVNEYRSLFSGIDDDEFNTIMTALGLDNRISNKFLSSGPGFGGSCFRKDIGALVSYAEKLGFTRHDLPLLFNTNNSNKQRTKKCIEIIEIIINKYYHSKNILILGSAFKAGTDDIRYSTAIEIIESLIKNIEANIIIQDPYAIKNTKAYFEGKSITNVEYSDVKDAVSLSKLVNKSDLTLILTDWDVYKFMFRKQSELITNEASIFIDTRHIVDTKYNPVQI